MKINVDLLKDYRSDFSNEKENFNSSSYGTFSSGYINRCSDNYVIRMRDKLRKLYQNIEKAYKNIDSWWEDYNNDIESLERALSHDGRSGAIKSSSVRSYIDSLPSLKNYSINFSGVINLNFEKAIPTFDMDNNNIIFTSSMSTDTSKGTSLIDGFFAFLSDTGAAISEGWENSNFVHWLNDNVSPWLVDVNNNIYEVCENTVATIETGVISVAEGFLGFGESVIDSLAVLSAASAEFQMNYDSNFQVIIDDNVGYFGEDTQYLWEQTQSFVTEEQVTTWFDNFYENSPHGQDLVNNAYFFDTVRQVGNGIGHTFGVVSFSTATFGVTGLGTLTGTMTTYAAFSGFGSGTEDAWKSGATIEEGVFTGIANASWEGFQWWIGGKIGSFDGKIGKFALINDNGKISSNILKSLFRIGADSLDGGVEGFVQPLISGIYQDGYYDENGNYIEFTENDNFWKRYAELFDDAGGLANVGIQTFIGAGGSLIGELFDLSKILRESSDVKVEVTNEYVVPSDIKGIEKFRNSDELYEAYIHGETKLNYMEYMNAMDYFTVRDRMVIEPDFGKSLEDIFFDDDYVIGVHRLGWDGNADSIIRDGLNLTGHSSSGAFVNDIDLKHNITFHEEYVSFLKALSEGSVYKRGDAGFGDVVIIKIPKSEINNLNSLVYYPDGFPVLKPEYIQGKVSSFIDENGKFHLTNDSNIMDLHIKAKELKELIEIKNSKEYLQYLDDINNGDAMVLNPDYDDIDIRIAELEREIKAVEGETGDKVDIINQNFVNSLDVKDTLDGIIEKMGDSSGRRALLMYAANGNTNRIPVEFREQIKNITPADINDYFDIEKNEIGVQFFANKPPDVVSNGRPPYLTEFKPGKDFFGGNQSSCIDKLKKLFKSSADKMELKNLEATVRQYYPDMTKQEMTAFFTRLNRHGCTYVAAANSIFEQLNYDADLFRKKFGFEMYLPNGELNHNQLILDIFSSLSTMVEIEYRKAPTLTFTSWTAAVKKFYGEELSNSDAFLKMNNEIQKNGWSSSVDDMGNITITMFEGDRRSTIGTPNDIVKNILGMDLEANSETELLEILGSNGVFGSIKTSLDEEFDARKVFGGLTDKDIGKWVNAYFENRGIDMSADVSRIYASSLDSVSLFKKLTDLYNSGYSIEVSAPGSRITALTDGSKFGYAYIGEKHVGHAMIFRGITEEGSLIVSSWGKYYLIDKEYVPGLEFSIIKIKGIDSIVDELQINLKRREELLQIRSSQEYISYLEELNSGESVVYIPEYHNLETELNRLTVEIDKNKELLDGRNIDVDKIIKQAKLEAILPKSIIVDATTGKSIDTSKLLKIMQDSEEFDKFLNYWSNRTHFSDGPQTQYLNGIRQILDIANKDGVDLGLGEVEFKLLNNFERYSSWGRYTAYSTIQIIGEHKKYKEQCKLFFQMARDNETKAKLETILFEGGYDDFAISSNIVNRDNPGLEAERRLSMAYLLIRNPETFDVLVQNKVNLFHGSNANAMFSILKYGLNSGAESEKLGIYVSTGEKWSRVEGKQRDFVSFTDILDIAEDYSLIQPELSDDNFAFPIIIGTTVDDAKHAGTCLVHSDVSEVGVRNKLPLDGIKVIGVPSEKLAFVEKLLDNDNIKVVAIDDIGDKDYSEDRLKDIFEKYYQTKETTQSTNVPNLFEPEQIETVMLGRNFSTIKRQFEETKFILTGGEN